MKKFKGTPGPWSGKDVRICRQDRAGLQLGFIMIHDENRVAECEANAHLIAAAPELLEALQLLLNSWSNGSSKDISNAERKARSAISKALGEE
ncbi:hypothetical protein SHG54_002611 [Salmonella enterica]|nr:hypothetical protein [Salmonella enterica]